MSDPLPRRIPLSPRARKLVAFLVLGLGVWFVGRALWPVAPRDTELRLRLGAFHEGADRARSVEVVLSRGGAPVRVFRTRFMAAPPDEWRQTVSLAPGDYQAAVSVELPARVATREGPVHVAAGEPVELPAPHAE